MHNPKPAVRYSVISILLAAALLFLTFNKHSKSGFFNYHSEIWGDKAGYYVYLPAMFIYSFDATRFPPGIDSLTGNGFRLDLENNKVITKYTCGVAIMLSPFFIVTHALTGLLDAPDDGFSAPYHRMIDVAAIVYLLAGFLLWYRFLRKYFTQTIALLTIAALFLGTNLYYYAVDETGMSHVYSFFLFSLYLFTAQRVISERSKSITRMSMTGLAAALIVLVKPVNVFFLPVILFLDIASVKELRSRLFFLFQWKFLLIMAIVALVVFLPQALYWHSVYGRFIAYTYQGEGFTYLAQPRIIEYLFSTNNGLILYNPIILFGFSGIILMLVKHKNNRWMVTVLLFFTIYLFSSWWNWYFGCGYGNRSFTEYVSLLALPFGYQINAIWQYNRLVKSTWVFIICLLILLNLKMIYSWDGCWYGTTWDWERFASLVFSAPK